MLVILSGSNPYEHVIWINLNNANLQWNNAKSVVIVNNRNSSFFGCWLQCVALCSSVCVVIWLHPRWRCQEGSYVLSGFISRFVGYFSSRMQAGSSAPLSRGRARDPPCSYPPKETRVYLLSLRRCTLPCLHGTPFASYFPLAPRASGTEVPCLHQITRPTFDFCFPNS